MQHSSMVQFCDECGLANDLTASACSACQHPLPRQANGSSSSVAVAPVAITPAPVLEVTPGSLFATQSQSSLVEAWPPFGLAHPAADFLPGMLLARRYRIEQEIGRGGFSVVYRATDLNARHREVAIKRIMLSTLNPRQIIDATETFNRELTMLARFKGMSGVPAFYEHLTDAENWYLIMQYIPGQTLDEYLHKKSAGYISEEETIILGRGIARLMQKLHESSPPVIFRDLKPSNIMLTSQHEFFLIDFGIARNYTPEKKRDTTPLGSPGFAPPEQYGRAQTDQRSDIYSLGATLQTLLTGRDPQDLRAGEASLNPRPPSRLMRKLLDDMMAPDSSQRPWSMARIESRLEEVENQGQGLRSFWLGFLLSLVFCAIAALFISNGTHGNWMGSLVFPLLILGRLLNRGIRRALGIQKVITRPLWFGMVAAALPVAVLLILRFTLWL